MKQLFIILTILSFGFAVVSCSSGDAGASGSDSNDTAAVEDTSSPGDEDSSGNNNKNQKDRKNGEDAREDGPKPVPVEITTLTRGVISSFLLYSSTLETEQTVDVYCRIGGLVEEIYVEESQRVRKGQKLIQIEKDEYDLAEQNARIEYEKQKSNFERVKALQEGELLSQEEFDNAELTVKQAEIAWKQAALSLKYTTVTSPISGVIGDRLVRLGDRVQTSSHLFTIANLDEKIVRVYVPQNQFPKCYNNQPAVVTTDVLPGVKFKANVKRISPIIDPQSGTFKVTLAVKDPKNKIRPGMFVNAQLIVDTHEDTPLIPKAALIYENERTYFFYAANDSAKKVELQKGFEDAEKVEVLNNLPIGSKIIVLGQNGLKEGSKVKIINEKNYAWQENSGDPISANTTSISLN